MTCQAVHIIKLCVGADSMDDLADWQRRHPPMAHTRHLPTRRDEILAGGSLYWVIKGLIQCRQIICGFDSADDGSGRAMGLILLEPGIIPVKPVPRRAFQGWRYLTTADAPPDLGADDGGDMPDDLRAELMRLGVW